jgi:alkanesulfonate monooxygenase SsuD/methylene tetrahydromethanopterin reductase-like flavin-dependent oxidoreductase (luciferase family)
VGQRIGEFVGEHVSVEPSWSWPKPTAPGGPPVHLGARAGDAVFADIAAWGDGWIPLEGYGPIVEAIPRLRHAFEAAGRDPDDVQVTVYSSAGRPHDIDRYQAAGVNRVVCWLPPTAERDLMTDLDELTKRLESHMREAGS